MSVVCIGLTQAHPSYVYIYFFRFFNFDQWCKRFVAWVDQNKLKVDDLFIRFAHDGMLTREQFKNGLTASGKERGNCVRINYCLKYFLS